MFLISLSNGDDTPAAWSEAGSSSQTESSGAALITTSLSVINTSFH